MAYSPYKMKGHTLPGIKQRPDWVKQAQEKKIMKDLAKNPKSGINPLTEGKKIDRKYSSKSPTKWAQFIPLAISAVSSMAKNSQKED